MKGNKQTGWWVFAVAIILLLPATTWGYFFDDRREMSLSGFAYMRGTWALANDDIGNFKGLWQRGNLVQQRNFVTLEWRHNLNRISREFPTLGEGFRFLNFDALDYYLNMRFEYDGVWWFGGSAARHLRQGGENHWNKYWGNTRPAYPGQFTRWNNFGFQTIRRRDKELLWNLRLFEAYANITKGPLFVRIGRQNLSWGEADGFRLLDQINPLDNNFGGFTTALDERRIPLNMIRAQWSFGTVGPIGDLTAEGFYSVDQETGAWPTTGGTFWNVPNGTGTITIGRTPCGDPFFRTKDDRTPAHPNGYPCSLRAKGPHASISDGRGGGRILGTIHDFTFSIAHYYTWSDNPGGVYVQAGIIAPTPEHLLWDISPAGFTQLTGKAAVPANNPWSPTDPVVGLGNVVGGPGGILAGTPGAAERSIRSVVSTKRIQITGGSLAFPLNALTGMFVGSDNPLYYIYTTVRAEVAYFNNVPVSKQYHDFNGTVAFQRFLTPTLAAAGIASPFRNDLFLPGQPFSSEGGSRQSHVGTRDFYAWVIGLDHNQWIRWLNPTNSFTISSQLFWARGLGVNKRFKQGVPPGLLNDSDAIPVTRRDSAPTGPNPTPQEAARPGGTGSRTTVNCITAVPGGPTPCIYKPIFGFPVESQLFTLFISTPYLAGNLTPNVTFFYDFAGSWLIQPGVNWTFWDPWRMQIRYNFIDGKYTGIGFLKTRDSIWLELQYLLY
jgi:hypothetical protein